MHEELNSYFGAGVKMNGVLKFQGALRFDGLFQGEIKTSDTLIVGNNGKIEAKVSTGSLFNMGEIIGDIKALEKISIYNDSHITGNIDTPVLKAEEGAVFMGNCHMPYNPPKSKSSKNNGDSEDPVKALLSEFEVSNQASTSGEKEDISESSFFSDVYEKLKKPVAVAAVFIGLYFAGAWFVQWSREEIRSNKLSISIYTYYLGNDSGKVQKLADIRFERGDYGQAADLYIQARRISKGGIPLGKNLPVAVEKSKGMKEAAPYYQEYVKNNPTAADVAQKLTKFYDKSGFVEGQISVMETLLSSNPKDKALSEQLYKLYIKTGLTEKALNIFEQNLASKKPTSDDLMTIGNFEKKLNRISDSIKTFKKLVVLDRKNLDGHLALAYLYHKSGKEWMAAGEFRRVQKLDREHVEALNNEGFENLSGGINDKALELFNLALAKNPDNLRAYHGLATTYVKLGDRERAKYYCNKILGLDPAYAPALNRLAWILAIEMKDLDKAEKYSIASMQFDKALPDYKDTLAEIYFRKGDVNNALKTIKQALKLKPRSAWYKSQLKKFSNANIAAEDLISEGSVQSAESGELTDEPTSENNDATEYEPASDTSPAGE
jgi:tetratricopeptide (TPR) repeat protein